MSSLNSTAHRIIRFPGRTVTEREVVLDFVPRSEFLPFHKRKQRRACLICQPYDQFFDLAA